MILIFGLQLCSCSPEKRQLRSEMNSLADFIIDGLSNDDIELAEKEYSENNGIFITLYGSDKSEDILELINICNEWMENNQESYAVSDGLRISVDLYRNKPVTQGWERHNYVVRIGNYSDYFGDYAAGSDFDCLEIRYCDNLQTSIFRSFSVDYRYISMPSTVEIDDFDVFVDMNELDVLVIDDAGFEVDDQRVVEKYNEIVALADEYSDLQFEICYLADVLN